MSKSENDLVMHLITLRISRMPDSAGSPAEWLAMMFHEKYERLAPSFSYSTREASAKPWEDVPENNKKLMIAVCQEFLDETEEDIKP